MKSLKNVYMNIWYKIHNIYIYPSSNPYKIIKPDKINNDNHIITRYFKDISKFVHSIEARPLSRFV